MTQTLEPAAGPLQPYDLADRYRVSERPVLLTGVQAVARLVAEQHERDARAGLHTATFVSGYQGSPLAGLDKTLAGVRELHREHDLRLVPGLNEELGATAVWGSQTPLPQGTSTHDGVVGLWYGKGPGLDRSGDAIRHASFYGANPRGGVLALTGDDPASSSSTVPCASERALAGMGLPVIYPRNSAELIRFGLMGIALSRASGVWVGMKIVTTVADGMFTVAEDFQALDITIPQIEWEGRPWEYQQRVLAAPTDSLLAEADLFGPRWEMVEAFREANPFDEITVDPEHASLGIMAPGATYDALLQSLGNLGVDEAALHRAGIRLMRVGMPYPLGGPMVRTFARGLDTLLVVEEKTSFVESAVRELLYGGPDTPVILGKKDAQGRLLVPAGGLLSADALTPALRRVLTDRVALKEPARPARINLGITPVAQRTPYFCSGCPHNRSTVLPEGSIGAGGIGCHTMVTMASRETSQVTGLTHMGGEGVQWIGQAPYTDVGHIFQNVGDGTYFHSGQLAVQACIAAGVNITYKILFNQVVAMTGAQDAQGALTVPALTRKLRAEGVERIIVCSEDPRSYDRRDRFAPGTSVWDRDRLDEAQRELREVPGVSVLIYDQQCAAEARRLRKRGQLEQRTQRVIINEAVCEGCGDCGVKSNCLSVQPVDTAFGRKTRIDQTSCNTDYSCLDGDCPSFLTVQIDPKAPATPDRVTPEAPQVPDPQVPVPTPGYDVFIAGVGGTGIVTVNAVLATAALNDGLRASGLDQTGLSQKAGPVTSHLRIGVEDGPLSNRVSQGRAHTVLAMDLMVATDPKNLSLAGPDQTITISSTSRTPTGEMVFDPAVRYPDEAEMVGRLRGASAQLHHLDALAAAQSLFGATEVANLLVIGAAYQAGALPLSAAALEQAIRMNGVQVEQNLAAFRWGRVAVADPAAFAAATTEAAAVDAPVADDGQRFVDGRALSTTTAAEVASRAADLAGHSGEAAAQEYVTLVEAVAAAEQRIGAGDELSRAVAHGAHRLLAYKDEYEVARLLTDPVAEAAVRAQMPGASGQRYNLHPPMLRALGYDKKISLGPWFRPVLKGLAKGRGLRGSALDPFGWAHVRRVERALAADYLALVKGLLERLDLDSYERAVELARSADLVRGYEDVKMRSVAEYQSRRAELGLPLSAELQRLLQR